MDLAKYFPELLESDQDQVNSYVYFGDERANAQLHVKQFGFMKAGESYSYGPAVRDHLLIHFVVSGKGELFVGEKRYEIHEGQMFIVPANEVSFYGADEKAPWIYYYIGLRGTLSDAVMNGFRQNDSNIFHRSFDLCDTLPLLEEMHRDMHKENNYLILLAGAYKLVELLSRSQDVKKGGETGLYRETIDSQIRRVMVRVERDFDTGISVQQIADELGVNRSHLAQHFKRYTGYTVKGYITALRIKRAKIQLSHLQLSIQEVAQRSGYGDPLFFSRMFKKHTGYSPTEYREILRDGIEENM